MSLRIIKAGLLDTFQDAGRWGFQHMGINPGGVMDPFSARLCNALLGKDPSSPVLELHFPSAAILFDSPTVFSISGADFSAQVNGHPVPTDHPVAVSTGSVLKFTGMKTGARAYVGFLHRLKLDNWLGSYSTNLRVNSGGFAGRALISGDIIPFMDPSPEIADPPAPGFTVLHWKSSETISPNPEVSCIIGSEWNWLTEESRESFQTSWFQISNEADRMGYRLAGNRLEMLHPAQLISSAVSFGTVQLLPGGQLILLMADRGTTGGYPRLAHVISADLPQLAQKKPNDVIRFRLIRLEEAEEKLLARERYLRQLRTASAYRIRDWLNVNRNPS